MTCMRRGTALGIVLGVVGAGASFATGAERTAAAVGAQGSGVVHTVNVKLKTPKSGRDKRVSRPLDEVSMSMYVPAAAKVIRGAVFNPFYEATVKQDHWRTAVGLWDFALIGSNFFRIRSDELGLTLRQGLKQLAQAGGRPEVANVPLCLVGMSIGAGLTTRITEAMPQRILAAGPVCLEVGPRGEASGRVPMITIFGERDGRQMEILAGKLPQARVNRAQWATAVQWRLRHDFARANNLLVPLFDHAIRYRYPKGATPLRGPVKLKDYREADGWLGDPNTWTGDSPTIGPVGGFAADATKACWLPDRYLAAVWQAFVVRDPKVTLIEPAGMGDGKPFSWHPPRAAIRVRVEVSRELEVGRLELHDGDGMLAEFPKGKRELTLDALDPGVHALIASATSQAGQRFISRPNTILVVAQPKRAAADE